LALSLSPAPVPVPGSWQVSAQVVDTCHDMCRGRVTTGVLTRVGRKMVSGPPFFGLHLLHFPRSLPRHPLSFPTFSFWYALAVLSLGNTTGRGAGEVETGFGRDASGWRAGPFARGHRHQLLRAFRVVFRLGRGFVIAQHGLSGIQIASQNLDLDRSKSIDGKWI